MKYDRIESTLALEGPVRKVKAISPAREKVLNGLGIYTIRDLITHFPFRYLDMSRVETAASAAINETCTIVGNVHEIALKKPKPRLNLVEISLVDASGVLIVTCFRQPWLVDSIKVGDRLAVAGKIEFTYGFKRMTNPFLEVLDDSSGEAGGLILPMHHSTEKLSATWMRRLVKNALAHCKGPLDPLPLHLRIKYRLASRQSALQAIHFPRTMEDAQAARRRLSYEEIFFFELQLMQSGAKRSEGKRPIAHTIDGSLMKKLDDLVPFELTGEQQRAKDELLQAMSNPTSANHMLLGDVGTGKTIVAVFGIVAAVNSKTQVAVMAPTEILVQQYAQSIGSFLDDLAISWALLTGSTAANERASTLERLKAKELSVIFGTHALLEKTVVFSQLGLVIIDEQHRFGVNQRARLLEKGSAPDALYLTATPIPRTLALALYGNLTLSYLKERPLNVVGNTTKVYDHKRRGHAYDAALAALKKGSQVYIVCPLVGVERSSEQEAPSLEISHEEITVDIEDEHYKQGDLKAAVSHADYLQNKVFVDHTIALLHGRMSSEEKQTVMDDFRKGKIEVLVTTTVIEVGVDVTNAAVMIIEDADRFGLAQLHQLRGRVGRGTEPGEVYLISSSRAPLALERLGAMEKSDDGLELATYDLSLRREGDLLGSKQHGTSTLKLINVVRDGNIIEAAHKDARDILAQDPHLEQEEHQALKRELRLLFNEDDAVIGS